MTDLEFRRMMMMQKMGGDIDNPYISNGMIMWIDGISRGGTSGKWKNLVGSKSEFTLHNVTELSDHCQFNGIDSYGNAILTANELAANDGTIEVVFSLGNSSNLMLIFMPQDDATKTTLKAFGVGGSNVIQSAKGRAPKGNQRFSVGAMHSLSMSTTNYYINGVKNAFLSDDYFSGINNVSYIGRRGSGNYFNGSIYSIRIYNRILSVDEILHNYAVDVTRFNTNNL